MRATAKGAPARCPAYAPHSASCRRVARSRMAMKCQGCVFFELCARLPAFRIERIASSDKGSSVNWRTARLVRISSETVIRMYLLWCLQTINKIAPSLAWVCSLMPHGFSTRVDTLPPECLLPGMNWRYLFQLRFRRDIDEDGLITG